jgi:hypothetical protein
VGHQSASTVVGAMSARSAVGHKSASTVVSALSARSAVVDQSASTVVGALSARSAGRTNTIGSKTKTKQRFWNRSSFHRELLSTLSPTRSCAVGKKWKNIVDRRRQPPASPPLVPPPPLTASSWPAHPGSTGCIPAAYPRRPAGTAHAWTPRSVCTVPPRPAPAFAAAYRAAHPWGPSRFASAPRTVCAHPRGPGPGAARV